ncbi:MAG TPA: hypothetical protein VFS58_06890, partial [Steroidobacteraceae bacterium]|nr:hypothetical protein [Steroidobacteraceae bacterium]
HYLEYVDDAMSFNFRFGRSRYGRFLCADNFHRDHYIQNFASGLVSGAAREQSHAQAADEIVQEFTAPAPDMLERVKRMRALFKKLCANVCPDHRAHEYCAPEMEETELERIMRDIGRKKVYADVETLSKLRPTGTISATQVRHIQESAARMGYPAGVLTRVLQNRLGKKILGSLSRAEAAQFLLHMRSPGAAW